MLTSPLDHVIGFWKPVMDSQELEALASYRAPSDPLACGINVWATDSDACRYRVSDGQAEFALHAAVHPIEVVPQSAEVLAEIRDQAGEIYSYVLWYADDQSLVLPFDPSAAIESFWYERYVHPGERTVLPRFMLEAYYRFLKPRLATGLKWHLRSAFARRASATGHFLEWPADQSLDQLQRLLLRTILLASGKEEVRFLWFWPDCYPWAAVLTHDVETAEGLAGIAHVADMERQRGLRSSFNLVPEDYAIPGSLLESLRKDGFEIGVHGLTHDGLTFTRWSTFLQRVVAINECGRQWKASGFRSPSTYRNQEWFHLLGFEYDSSVMDTSPFEPQPGGCASLFPYGINGLVELPITLPQDHTLFGLLHPADERIWSAKLSRIRDANGMACVLTHPDPKTGYVGLAENGAHYNVLLDALADSSAWTPLPRDLARWWRRRAGAVLDQAEGIEGASFGTAVLDTARHVEIVPPVP